MALVTVNAGSSSLKVSIFSDDERSNELIDTVFVEGIGSNEACVIPGGQYGSPETIRQSIASHEEAARTVAQWLQEQYAVGAHAITAIGHRVVHGGPRYTQAVVVTAEVESYLLSIASLAPNHTTATVSVIRTLRELFPDIVHVACFDTAFFAAVPERARILPISMELQREHQIRRYGFHGLSYEALLESFARYEGEVAARGRVVLAHLGSGASLAVCRDKIPLDMTMGFTPASGIMMSTRSGDIEPGVISYLQQQLELSSAATTVVYANEAGLLGVSGLSGDMHELLKAEANGHVGARRAIDLFCYMIAKQIGAFAAVAGGVDSLIFSGGIGERSADVRRRICVFLAYLGITLDDVRNQQSDRLISEDGSRVGVHVIQAEEEQSIMRHTQAVVRKERA